ncbi:MAG: hypothetical protein EBS53_01790 [Bacteroidetes bacterium]|nr:hypothetical protein [Bacteroidota bacterium]
MVHQGASPFFCFLRFLFPLTACFLIHVLFPPKEMMMISHHQTHLEGYWLCLNQGFNPRYL